ncbi:extracellular solute-binding protein [Streptomyces xinghaiensis]|uniref:ABC transporter substrate-binding protein n=1 Tax=Streptomyces xinghaiensis TaxID=1038928 RepID=UPI0002D696F7|nr:extracellular solute-binding protein [Streptomyces xinghaiensis]MZE79837.1 extracellular solute-binding protein [Streptomyces sp. SID5475]
MRRSAHMSRRTAALATTAALLTGLLAGCADDGGGSDRGDSGESTDGKKTVTIGVFGVFGYKQAGLYDEYQKLNPDVVIKETSIERADQYYPQLLTHLGTGSGLQDIQAIEVGNIAETVTRHADKFVDLGREKGVDEKNWLDWKWAQATAEDGRTIGLGTDVGPMAICYRKDLFEKAGLPTDREKVGALWAGDWEKYVETGEKYMEKAPSGTVYTDTAIGLFNASVSGRVERYYDRGGELIYKDSPAVKDSWDLAMRAVEGKMTARLKQFDKPWDQAYANGRFATVACPAWMLGYIKEKAGPKAADKWDIAPAPKPANWGGSFLSVPEAAKNKEEAVKLAAWLTAPEQQAKLFGKQASFPSSPATYEMPEVADARHEYFGDAPIGEIFSQAAEDMPTLVLGEKDLAIQTAFTDVGVLQVEQQGKSPEAGWDAALKNIDNLLDQ